MLPVLLSYHFELFFPFEKERIERESRAILAEYDYNGLSLRVQLLPYRRVGVQGDEKTYLPPLVISGMMPSKENAEITEEIASRLVREIRGINTVICDITPKP